MSSPSMTTGYMIKWSEQEYSNVLQENGIGQSWLMLKRQKLHNNILTLLFSFDSHESIS